MAFAFLESCCEIFDARLIVDEITIEEEENTKNLVKEKYATDEWNWKR